MKTMKMAILMFDGKVIARIENIHFPNVKESTKKISIKGLVEIFEDE